MLVLGRGVVAAGLADALQGRTAVEHDFDPKVMRDVRSVVEAHRPAVAVWMMSWDDVGAAEANEDRAYLENAEATINLAAAVMEFGTTPVLISTPEVFGQRGGPWAESDEPQPRSVWAESRRRGEVLLMRAAPNAIVLRVGPVLSPDLSIERRRLVRGLGVAAARRVSPVSVTALAQMIESVVEGELRGVVHAAVEPPIRERDFYRAIADRLGLEGAVEVREPRTTEAPNPAMRSDRLTLAGVPSWRSTLEALEPAPPPAEEADDAWASGPGYVARRHELALGSVVRGTGRRSFFVESGKLAVEDGGADRIVETGGHFTVEAGPLQIVALAASVVFDIEG